MVGFLKNLFAKKVFGRQTRVNLNDLHQVYLIPYNQSGQLIDERLMLKDISLEGFAIRASLEEWGFGRGMELEANLHLWDKVFVVRFRFLHLHDNFSGGKIVHASDDYEHEFFKVFEPELRGLALLNEITTCNDPAQEIFRNDFCGVQLNKDDFIFYYQEKIVRSYHGQIRVFDYFSERPMKFKNLNQHPETDNFDLETLHVLMRFILNFRGITEINIDKIASSLQNRYRKEFHASDK